jgi:hypothetical protein
MEDSKPIEIDLRKYNKLSFDLELEGADPDKLNGCKFVIEDKEMSFMFEATYDTDSSAFNILIPPLINNLQESKIYKSKLQVLIENQVFEPLETFIKGKESPKIKIGNFQNESVQPTIKTNPVTKVSTVNVKVISKEPTKEQLFETIRSLKNRVVDLETNEPDSEELFEAKKELVSVFKRYKAMP